MQKSKGLTKLLNAGGSNEQIGGKKCPQALEHEGYQGNVARLELPRANNKDMLIKKGIGKTNETNQGQKQA